MLLRASRAAAERTGLSRGTGLRSQPLEQVPALAAIDLREHARALSKRVRCASSPFGRNCVLNAYGPRGPYGLLGGQLLVRRLYAYVTCSVGMNPWRREGSELTAR
jgi:hypothetical protein